MTSRFYRGAKAVIIAYDCCVESSLYSVDQWCSDVYCYLDIEVPIVLVACKKDLQRDSPTAVSIEHAQRLAISRGYAACVETSAKTGEGIEKVFKIVTTEVLSRCGKLGKVSIVFSYCYSVKVTGCCEHKLHHTYVSYSWRVVFVCILLDFLH